MIIGKQIALIAAIFHMASSAIVYDQNLKCSQCILGGYNFCTQMQEGQQVADGKEMSSYSTFCAEDSSFQDYSDPSWTCSAFYADVTYALTMCPFQQDKCGDKESIQFSNELNETTSIQVKNLSQGESCAFEIKSNCNSPAFRMVDSWMMDDKNVDIYFIEYEKAFINSTIVDGDTTDNNDKHWTMPSDDKPPRNITYKDIGSQNKSCAMMIKPAYMFQGEYPREDDIRSEYPWADKIDIEYNYQNDTFSIKMCAKRQFTPSRKNSTNYTRVEDFYYTFRQTYEEKSTNDVEPLIDVDAMDTDGMGGWSDSYSNNEYYREYIELVNSYNSYQEDMENYWDNYRNSSSWDENYGPGYYNYYYDDQGNYQRGEVWDPYGGYDTDNQATDPYYGMEDYKTYFDHYTGKYYTFYDPDDAYTFTSRFGWQGSGGGENPYGYFDGFDYFMPNFTSNSDIQWGNYWEFLNFTYNTFTDKFFTNYTQPEEGFGVPSKGAYSLELGGYKTFGTEGQGKSSFGLKDDLSYTCSERVMMLIVVARDDTNKDPDNNSTNESNYDMYKNNSSDYSDNSSNDSDNYYYVDWSPTMDNYYNDGSNTYYDTSQQDYYYDTIYSKSSPRVRQSQQTSYVSFEIGNFQFVDDLVIEREQSGGGQPSEEAATHLGPQASLNMLMIFTTLSILYYHM